jgi:hypothetical protein
MSLLGLVRSVRVPSEEAMWAKARRAAVVKS